MIDTVAAAINFEKLIEWVGQFWRFFSALLKMTFFVPALPSPHHAHFFNID